MLVQYASVLSDGLLSSLLASIADFFIVFSSRASMHGLTVSLKDGSKSLIKCSEANVFASFGAIRGSTEPSMNWLQNCSSALLHSVTNIFILCPSCSISDRRIGLTILSGALLDIVTMISYSFVVLHSVTNSFIL